MDTSVYDAGRDRVVCHFQSNNWEFDGSAWQVIQSTPSPPFNGMMAYDEIRGVIVMYTFDSNGVMQTWERSGLNWALVNVGAPVFESITFHHGRGRVMAFGGGSNPQVPGNDLYEWDGVNWTLIPTTNAPPRVLPGPLPAQVTYGFLTHDGRRDKLCMFGAGYIYGTTPTFLTQTWEWDAGNGWILRNVGGPTTGGVTYFDTQRGVLSLITRNSSGQFQPWEWDGVGQWTQIGGALGPLTARYFMASLVYDSKRGRVLIMFPDDTFWASGPTAPARYAPHGAGCGGGSVAPDLALAFPWSRAWVGSVATPGYTLSLDVTNLPQSVALLAMGFSDQSYASTPLPVDLGAVGMPGCFVRIAPEATQVLVGAGGIANFQLPIPRTASLVGQPFFVQAFVPAPGANPAGILVTPSYRGTVGFLR